MTELRRAVHNMLNEAWQSDGFCVPNLATYPFQWLWDSCFHAIIWAELGDERALLELQSALAHQSEDGFVPHLTYWANPSHQATFWGQSTTSTITQPPMFGHAAAALLRMGIDVPEETLTRCRRGLSYLLHSRKRHACGLVPVFHPWETGCDDSIRWDDWRGGESWFETKGQLVDALDVRGGHAVASSAFSVASAGFNALVAWNVAELDAVGEAGELAESGRELAQCLASQWDGSVQTWVDAGSAIGSRSASQSGTARTLDALLPSLVDPRPEVFHQLRTGGGFGAPFGPTGVHRDDARYDPNTYWRGPAWPQLSYLCIQAAAQAGESELAGELHQSLARAGTTSELSEYWNPDTGMGRGARPQSWAGLSILPVPKPAH